MDFNENIFDLKTFPIIKTTLKYTKSEVKFSSWSSF